MADGEGNDVVLAFVIGVVLLEFIREGFDDIAGHAGFFGDNEDFGGFNGQCSAILPGVVGNAIYIRMTAPSKPRGTKAYGRTVGTFTRLGATCIFGAAVLE